MLLVHEVNAPVLSALGPMLVDPVLLLLMLC